MHLIFKKDNQEVPIGTSKVFKLNEGIVINNSRYVTIHETRYPTEEDPKGRILCNKEGKYFVSLYPEVIGAIWIEEEEEEIYESLECPSCGMEDEATAVFCSNCDFEF